jgi:hypothetical protein
MIIPASPAEGSSWRTSTYSTGNGECVEIAFDKDWVSVRDSKNPEGPILSYSPVAFRSFLNATKKTIIASGIHPKS